MIAIGNHVNILICCAVRHPKGEGFGNGNRGCLKETAPEMGKIYTVGWLAASMILTNFSGTREAPPMRPPSMSG